MRWGCLVIRSLELREIGMVEAPREFPPQLKTDEDKEILWGMHFEKLQMPYVMSITGNEDEQELSPLDFQAIALFRSTPATGGRAADPIASG
jgi:hypothetical protein